MTSLWKKTVFGLLATLVLASVAAAEESAAKGRRYLLLLQEDARYKAAAPAARAERIDEYRQWSRTTPGIESGDKLSAEAWSLSETGAAKVSPKKGESFVAGLFVIRADGDQEAIRLAQSCPHLRYGGRIELRPIE